MSSLTLVNFQPRTTPSGSLITGPTNAISLTLKVFTNSFKSFSSSILISELETNI